MCDAMSFPDNVEDFMDEYKMVDTNFVYSNGIEYVPIFRMQQWFEHVGDIESWVPEPCRKCSSNPRNGGTGICHCTLQPDWNEMIVLCDCCGHAIHVKRIDVERREDE